MLTKSARSPRLLNCGPPLSIRIFITLGDWLWLVKTSLDVCERSEFRMIDFARPSGIGRFSANLRFRKKFSFDLRSALRQKFLLFREKVAAGSNFKESSGILPVARSSSDNAGI